VKKYQLPWLFSFIILTILFGVIYKASRISLDSALYDPLATEAVDVAWETAIRAEKEGKVSAPTPKQINVETSPVTFVTVYDKDKKVVGSSGDLDKNPPQLPPEFLEDTDPYARNYFSWEPKEGVHLAGVTVSMGEYGYVLAGRSMQEADRQGTRLTKMVVIGWLASVSLMTAGFALANHNKGK